MFLPLLITLVAALNFLQLIFHSSVVVLHVDLCSSIVQASTSYVTNLCVWVSVGRWAGQVTWYY